MQGNMITITGLRNNEQQLSYQSSKYIKYYNFFSALYKRESKYSLTMNTRLNYICTYVVYLHHRVPKEFSILNISAIGETLIFRCGIVIRIMPYTYFSPPLLLHFTQRRYLIIFTYALRIFPFFNQYFRFFEKSVKGSDSGG